jgi:dihydrofolate synthase/folylpolyglutamate synthase
VSVVTSVSIDHTHQLGGTLERIAAEKAGIIKPGVPVVCQPQRPEAMAVIERAARRAGSPLLTVGRDVAYTWAPVQGTGIRLAVRTPHAAYDDLFLPLLGEHQAVNAATALAAAERSGPFAERLTPERVRGGLRRVRWPGRMELVPGRPDMLLDGAHNRASMERLMEGLAQHFPGRPRVFVFASAADKDIDGMLAVLAETGGGAPVVFTRTENPRAAAPVDLAARFAGRGGRGAETAPDTGAALDAARRKAPAGGLVVVCGSLYLVGEVKTLPACEGDAPAKAGG